MRSCQNRSTTCSSPTPSTGSRIRVVCAKFSKLVMAGGLAEPGSKLASLCSIGQTHPFVPTCLPAERRAQPRSRLAVGHRRRRRAALWKMAMTHHALMARLGLEIRMLCEKLSNLRLDRLSQQRTRAAAQDVCQGVGEDPWLGELDDVIVGHGVSLLHWRSGGVEHHHDTPPYPVSPSPTSGHSSSTCPNFCTA